MSEPESIGLRAALASLGAELGTMAAELAKERAARVFAEESLAKTKTALAGARYEADVGRESARRITEAEADNDALRKQLQTAIDRAVASESARDGAIARSEAAKADVARLVDQARAADGHALARAEAKARQLEIQANADTDAFKRERVERIHAERARDEALERLKSLERTLNARGGG